MALSPREGGEPEVQPGPCRNTSGLFTCPTCYSWPMSPGSTGMTFTIAAPSSLPPFGRIQLQLYRLPGKGWGVRTVQDLPQGAFLCR